MSPLKFVKLWGPDNYAAFEHAVRMHKYDGSRRPAVR